MGFGLTGVLGLTGLASWVGKVQNGAGRGGWDMGATVRVSGHISISPYAHIRVMEGSGVRTLLLGCETKCGVRERLEDIAYAGGGATVTGTLIERDGYAMLAVPDGLDWLEQTPDLQIPPAPRMRSLGSADLVGEILDSKCWFGAMRPNEGLSHKACATLCIASGIAPYFGVKDGQGRERALMITNPEGEQLITEILPYVAELVHAMGELVQFDDLIQFRINPNTLARV